MKNLKAFLTVREAAEVLGVSSKTLRRWDTARKLTPTRHPMNGYRLYDRQELLSLLNRLNFSLKKSDRRRNNEHKIASKTS